MRAVLLCLTVACLWGCNAGDGGDISGGDVGGGGDVSGGDADIEAKVADGTWTDPTSGLTWQVTPMWKTMTWANANAHCSGLDLAGGGWRLPDVGELRSLIRGCPATMTGGTCNVQPGSCLELACRDGSCDGCSTYGGPAESGMYWPDEIEGGCCWYWSSSPVEDLSVFMWFVSFAIGHVFYDHVNFEYLVRCVR